MDSALVVQANRLNNLLSRLGDGWGLLSEARRWDVREYPQAEAWAHPVAAAVDAERRETFTQPHTHFATESTLTLTYHSPGMEQALQKSAASPGRNRCGTL
jgi:type IV secretion system protein VirB4